MTSSEHYYVKIQGRVLGPYDQPRMMAMISRGEVNRIHQFSRDNRIWFPSANFPELFPPSRNTTNQASQNASTATPIMASPVESRGEWYYAIHGQQYGPVDSATLRSLVQAGNLSASDLVWKEGLADWVPLMSVLVVGGNQTANVYSPPSSPMNAHSGVINNTGPDSSNHPEILSLLGVIRGWQLTSFWVQILLALSCMGLAGVSIVAGFLNQDVNLWIGGTAALLTSILAITFGFMHFGLASRIKKARMQPTPNSLFGVISSLKGISIAHAMFLLLVLLLGIPLMVFVLVVRLLPQS